MKTQLENGIIKIFDLQVQTIDLYDQAVFTLEYSGLNVELGKINISETLSETKRKLGSFLLLTMTVHPQPDL